MSDDGQQSMRQRITTLTSLALVVLGIAMIVRTVTAGGGALAVGLLLGVLFIAAGIGRIWVARTGGARR
ncbi:unannotated protein [freshwater metagenome]|uniref:Unannotated protein n=1 Tax=freshwater metagenome TaxID=449393 RepID=A0A6J7IGS0_9ZZZZ|nr:hypothetical protein [Actinomycetota bacterium]